MEKEFNIALRADNGIIVLITNHINGVPLNTVAVFEIDPQLIFNTDPVSLHSHHADKLDAIDTGMNIYDEIEKAILEAKAVRA